MRKNLIRADVAALVVLAVSFCGCPPPPPGCDGGPDDPDTCPGPALPDDICNSKDEALSDSRCILTLGTAKEGYITTVGDGGIDQDWYSVSVGAVTQRSLLHINAGYTVPQTAVNFRVNVLQEDGTAAITCTGGLPCTASGVDHHGAAAPKPVDLILPFSQANAKVLVLVGDEGGTTQIRVDNRNAYHVQVDVMDNPDSNEPNDTQPTPITLTASGAVYTGTQSGFLATTDDVDKFSFDVSQTGRQIIYLHISTARALSPPTPYRVAFTLYDPDMQPIAEDNMDNEFLAVDLATAKLAPKTGTYTLVIKGYKSPNNPAPVAGDIRPDSKYNIDLRVMPDVDPSEPNDTLATAQIRAMSVGTTLNLTGRLSTIPDDEWFELDLPANGATTVIRYKLSVSATAGRFPPTSPVSSHQLRLTTQVTTGATPVDRQTACKTDRAACPRGSDDDPRLADLDGLVDQMCSLSDPPQCLWAEHNEEPQFQNLKNLEGSIPVPPHAGATKVYLVMRDVGRARLKYADDKDWTMRVSYEANLPDTASPVALGASTTNTNGFSAYGFGRVIGPPFDLNSGDGIRGPNDYQAVPTELDTYQFNLPGATDQAWSLAWDLSSPDGGSPAGDLFLDLDFNGVRRTMAYSSDSLTPWYLPQSFGNASVLFSRTTSGGTVSVTALPIGCWCVPASVAATGHIGITVGSFNRVSVDPIRYSLKQAMGAYPQGYTGADAGPQTCPSGPDAGCGFLR